MNQQLRLPLCIQSEKGNINIFEHFWRYGHKYYAQYFLASSLFQVASDNPILVVNYADRHGYVVKECSGHIAASQDETARFVSITFVHHSRYLAMSFCE